MMVLNGSSKEVKEIGIVGGGIMGLSLAYFLTKAGARVQVFEASDNLGGLAGPIYLDGAAIDRFYHAILSSDGHLRSLCEEIGIADRLRFRETKMGFYHQGRIYPMNDVRDFLLFPPLTWLDRFRLGLTVVGARLVRDWHSLEGVSIEDWLVRLGGRHTFEVIWRPLLKAKFDGNFTGTSATYIWARLNRMSSTRSGANQKEMAGHLIGGYITLVSALAERVQAAGGQVHLRTPIAEIVVQEGQLHGLRLVRPADGRNATAVQPVGGEVLPYDAVVATVQTPIFIRLIPGAPAGYREFLGRTRYMGIVCPLLVLDRPLSPYWTLNITDDRIPFTGVIETTNYIDPEYVGGYHLVYLPKYTQAESDWFRLSDDEVRHIWLEHLEQMFPDFERSSIRHMLIHRERYVEPIHPLNSLDQMPGVTTPVAGLYLANTAQIYPELTNGESVSHHARRAAQEIIASLAPRGASVSEPIPPLTAGSRSVMHAR